MAGGCAFFEYSLTGTVPATWTNLVTPIGDKVVKQAWTVQCMQLGLIAGTPGSGIKIRMVPQNAGNTNTEQTYWQGEVAGAYFQSFSGDPAKCANTLAELPDGTAIDNQPNGGFKLQVASLSATAPAKDLKVNAMAAINWSKLA